MATYTVIWRDQGDDFIITIVEHADDPAGMDRSDWMRLAATVEYAGWDEQEAKEIIDTIENDGYDLIGVILGEAVWVM